MPLAIMKKQIIMYSRKRCGAQHRLGTVHNPPYAVCPERSGQGFIKHFGAEGQTLDHFCRIQSNELEG